MKAPFKKRTEYIAFSINDGLYVGFEQNTFTKNYEYAKRFDITEVERIKKEYSAWRLNYEFHEINSKFVKEGHIAFINEKRDQLSHFLGGRVRGPENKIFHDGITDKQFGTLLEPYKSLIPDEPMDTKEQIEEELIKSAEQRKLHRSKETNELTNYEKGCLIIKDMNGYFSVADFRARFAKRYGAVYMENSSTSAIYQVINRMIKKEIIRKVDNGVYVRIVKTEGLA